MNNYLEVWKKYATFSGRARRAEYWEYIFVNYGFMLVLGLISEWLPWMIFVLIVYSFLMLIPYWAVSVRRLHDIGKSGWFIFINMVPFIGNIWHFILLCTAGDEGSNIYGNDPKEIEE